MGEICYYGLPLAEVFVDLFDSSEYYTPTHLAVGDAEQLDGFDEIVGEIAVKPAFDALNLTERFVGKRLCQVFAHEPTAVSYHVIHYRGEQVADAVEDAERWHECHSATSL